MKIILVFDTGYELNIDLFDNDRIPGYGYCDAFFFQFQVFKKGGNGPCHFFRFLQNAVFDRTIRKFCRAKAYNPEIVARFGNLADLYSMWPDIYTDWKLLFFGWKQSNLWKLYLGKRQTAHSSPCKEVYYCVIAMHQKPYKNKLQASFIFFHPIAASAI